MTYERVFNEDPSDLIIVCFSCHSKFHRKDKKAIKPRRTDVNGEFFKRRHLAVVKDGAVICQVDRSKHKRRLLPHEMVAVVNSKILDWDHCCTVLRDGSLYGSVGYVVGVDKKGVEYKLNSGSFEVIGKM